MPAVLGSTLAAGTESSASHAAAAGAPGRAQAAARSGTASASSGGSAGSVTEALFTRSPKAPTRSSFRSDLTGKLTSLGHVPAVLRCSVRDTRFCLARACGATCRLRQGHAPRKGLKASTAEQGNRSRSDAMYPEALLI